MWYFTTHRFGISLAGASLVTGSFAGRCLFFTSWAQATGPRATATTAHRARCIGFMGGFLKQRQDNVSNYCGGWDGAMPEENRLAGRTSGPLSRRGGLPPAIGAGDVDGHVPI